MKRNQAVQQSISQGNVTEYEGYLAKKQIPPEYPDFIRLLAEITDAVAAGDNVWFTFGGNRAKTQMLLTLHDGEDVRYVAAGSFRELCRLAAEIL